MQTLREEGRCMCHDTLKWRFLKEAVGELVLTDKKRWVKIHFKGQSLDKTLGIHRSPQTYFSVSTERKEKGEEEQEQEEEVVLEEAILFQLAYVPQHRHYLLGKSFQLSWQIRSGPPFVPINWGFDVLVCVIAPWPHHLLVVWLWVCVFTSLCLFLEQYNKLITATSSECENWMPRVRSAVLRECWQVILPPWYLLQL